MRHRSVRREPGGHIGADDLDDRPVCHRQHIERIAQPLVSGRENPDYVHDRASTRLLASTIRRKPATTAARLRTGRRVDVVAMVCDREPFTGPTGCCETAARQARSTAAPRARAGSDTNPGRDRSV